MGSGPKGYKNIFMLNTAEHEILNDHQNNILRNSDFLGGSDNPRMFFFPAHEC